MRKGAGEKKVGKRLTHKVWGYLSRAAAVVSSWYGKLRSFWNNLHPIAFSPRTRWRLRTPLPPSSAKLTVLKNRWHWVNNVSDASNAWRRKGVDELFSSTEFHWGSWDPNNPPDYQWGGTGAVPTSCNRSRWEFMIQCWAQHHGWILQPTPVRHIKILFSLHFFPLAFVIFHSHFVPVLGYRSRVVVLALRTIHSLQCSPAPIFGIRMPRCPSNPRNELKSDIHCRGKHLSTAKPYYRIPQCRHPPFTSWPSPDTIWISEYSSKSHKRDKK